MEDCRKCINAAKDPRNRYWCVQNPEYPWWVEDEEALTTGNCEKYSEVITDLTIPVAEIAALRDEVAELRQVIIGVNPPIQGMYKPWWVGPATCGGFLGHSNLTV